MKAQYTIITKDGIDEVIIIDKEAILIVETYSLVDAQILALKYFSGSYSIEDDEIFIDLDEMSLTNHPDIDRIEKERGKEYAEKHPGYYSFPIYPVNKNINNMEI